jgi:dTDP-4-dehydrorhamnose reductase
MVKILITGAHGQLGKELKKKLSPIHTVFCLGKKELDITKGKEVHKMIAGIKPEIIIHAAAFTAVDLCENERKTAFEVNGLGAGNVADAASETGARMFYISSDYVFDGTKDSPYLEEDEPNPQSIYGMSKWLGEQLVAKSKNTTIIRTSWLYGHDGKNFVKTMLQLGRKRKEIKVVNDQIGSPTYVNDLAEIIILLFDKRNAIYHISNSGSCSWYEFAKAIFEEAGLNQDCLLPTTTAEYGALAPRPAYSALKNKAIIEGNLNPPRNWRKALREFIQKEAGK